MPHSKIYIDHTKKLSLEEIKEKTFEDNNQPYLIYGYSPPFAVWVKFTLKNSSNEPIQKILQYDHEITTYISFFDKLDVHKTGLFIKENRDTLNPVFSINLKAFEERTYYIRTESVVTPLTIKLNLWDSQKFYGKELKHQSILSLFFGAMFLLIIYNLFLFLFTKDFSYLWYILYLSGMVSHHIYYIGFSSIYLPMEINQFVTSKVAYFIVVFPMLMLGLFTKTFLQTYKYPRINKVLDYYLLSISLILLITILFGITSGLQMVFYLSLVFYLFGVAVYGALKGSRQAYLVALGWSFLFISWFLMFLSSFGVFEIFEYFTYATEVGILGEAVIFSIALADRINTLRRSEKEASDKLILQQKSEGQRLTKEVKKAVKEKDTLFRELHHRVKNNMQMIISLIRLQNRDLEDKELEITENRIRAMSKVHELLYRRDESVEIDTKHYIEEVVEELVAGSTWGNKVDTRIEIDCFLGMNEAIYVGLIVNELVTNSLKHAFDENGGTVEISLTKEKDERELTVKDSGKGFREEQQKNSLGITLVELFAREQLKGSLEKLSTTGSGFKVRF